MGKVYRIDVTTTVYFYGKEFPECYELAEMASEEIELGNHESKWTALTAKDAEDLPDDVLESFPYGEDGDCHTIAEWLENA